MKNVIVHIGGSLYTAWQQALLIFPYLIPFVLPAQEPWTAEFPTVGTFSSIRVADLNGDGVRDIVMGAGREEFQSCDSAVIALDGRSGTLLWTVSAADQIFGSALFKDVNADGVPDVFIGGRSAELLAISGATGKVIWRFMEVNSSLSFEWFNFYNPQFIPDQSGDEFEDLLISNGGDVKAAPFDPNRPTGSLLSINSRTGKLLSVAAMPDRKETYMSPTIKQGAKGPEVVFGTGGETIGGALYVEALSAVVNSTPSGKDLNPAAVTTAALKTRALSRSSNKGYIGPVSCADLNQDGITDLIVNAVEGRLLAFDGRHHHLLWEVAIPQTESYSSPCIGYFNDDRTPDVFVSYGRGVWPKLGWGLQQMVDGKTGQVLFTDSLGFYQNTSPLAVDLNGDGRDEILMSLNFQEVDSLYRKYFYTTLMVIEFKSGDIVQVANTYEGSNLSSTPWVGDLDDDGFLDILFCHGTNLRHTYTFDGMKIHRIPTQIPVYREIQWGAYQGSQYDGIWKNTVDPVKH